MKKSIIFVFILLISVSILLFTGCNKKLATVDGIEIKQSEVDNYINLLQSQSTGEETIGDEGELKALETTFINILIIEKLIEKYAEENGITVSSQEIEEQMEPIISPFDSEEDFEKYLKDIGVNRSFIESKYKNQLLSEKTKSKVTANVMVTDQEVRQYYNDNKETSFLVPTRVKASHILAMFPWVEDNSEENEEGRDEALEKIELVEDKLKNGEEFEELARKYSDDKETADNGGDLDYINKGQMAEEKEFEKALFSLDEGEISGIIESSLGFHIIKIIDRQKEYYQDFEEVEENIKAYLLELYRYQGWEIFIYSLIGEANIEYFIDVEDNLEYEQEEDK